ncbi:glycoprotein 3-alpha-L-fucosyltransferase A-like [Dendronephthya gigantea]|uniref:glycoprotein 3-alpha-L-fucosyltransferase A-like n=1 Tax=Dendronephthya gigantea TaxID=151771 RepID=UPI00106C08F6|nr:glycoprotein 3-alpha-L-fucosyltransferase A-like [Dendronephthya gigantea]
MRPLMKPLTVVIGVVILSAFFILYKISSSWNLPAPYFRCNPSMRRHGLKKGRNFTILDWSPTFFSKENGLPVNVYFDNCLITRDKSQLENSDVVVIEVRGIRYFEDMPEGRSPWQRWVYLNIESPFHAILGERDYTMEDFTGKYAFNWTMTYRTDADIPMLHGWRVKKNQTERMNTNIDSIVRSKTKLAAALMSNCYYVKNGRDIYVEELQKYMMVDVFGKCGTLKCPGHYTKNACEKVKEYKFFLAFENSNCRDYVSFKIWMQGFGNNAVPVVFGANKEDYSKRVKVPPNSFIHADDFETPKALAEYLKMLDKNETAYRQFHLWRKTYKIDYDYRFMGTFAWCNLCSTLNRRCNEAPKWHKTITDFENPAKDCHQNKWVETQCENKTCSPEDRKD